MNDFGRRGSMLAALIISASMFFAAPMVLFAQQTDDEPPDMRKTMLINSFLPGTAQIALGQKREGRLIIAGSLSLSAAGYALLIVDQLLEEEASEMSLADIGFYRSDGRTYLWPPTDDTGLVKSDWIYNTGLLLSTWGSLIAGYSQWAAMRDFSDMRSDLSRRTGRESLGVLLRAPYDLKNILNFDFFPFFPMTILSQVDIDDLGVYERFFRMERVDFWGVNVHPALGLGLNTLFAIALVHANATVEELLFRGVQLENQGLVSSSISFGVAHLPNAFIPGVSIEDTIFQTLFATLFGFYVADRTRANQYRLERAIALHFWHNVVAFMFGYMESAANDVPTAFIPGVQFNLKF